MMFHESFSLKQKEKVQNSVEHKHNNTAQGMQGPRNIYNNTNKQIKV